MYIPWKKVILMHKETLCESLVKHWCEETLKRWTIFKHFHYISFVHCATVAERKKHKCLASTAQCLKIRAKVSFWQISWFLVQVFLEHDLWHFLIQNGFLFENSDATFLVFFNHCVIQGCGALAAHFLRTSSFSSQ